MFPRNAWFAAATFLFVATAVSRGSAAEVNLALGKPYTLAPAPKYEHCTDPGDATQLTDGQSTRQHFWTQKGTVGWHSAPYVTITVDLGRVEPIGGVSLTTAAGAADVTWPSVIRILVSDDGKSYRDVGDLVALDRKLNGRWPDGYAIRRLVTQELATRGRYVQFLVIPLAGKSYIFADEVEVLRGPEELLAREPGGEPVGDVASIVAASRFRRALHARVIDDAARLREAIQKAAIEEATKARLTEQAKSLEQTDEPSIPTDPAFRAVLPLNDTHAKVFPLQAELWRAAGLSAFSASAAVTWDPLELMGVPTRCEAPVQVHTMRGEYRAAAVNLVNAGQQPLQAKVHIEGLPDAPVPKYLTVHEVPWTDTAQSRPVAAALPEAQRVEGGWTVSVQPGLVRQLWLTFHVADQPAGQHAGTLVVEAEGLPPQRVPLQLRIWPLEFPKQTTLYVGGWSYTNGRGSYGITPENKKALVEHLQSHFVNAPWAGGSVMMKFAFDPSDPTKIKLDTAEFDDWIAQWPQARRYCIFANVGGNSGHSMDALGGAKLGSPEFDQRVATWIHAWVEHLRSKGVQPEQLALLLHDEPFEGINIETCLAWARAIRAAEPKVLIWEDPIYRDPTKTPPELCEVSHILCPNRPAWLRHGPEFAEFFRQQQQAGRTLEFYSCSGPARLLDPYSYFRLQAWHCWQIGATGSYFWAFGDTGGASSWCEYSVKHGPYCPLFLDDQSVTAGKQMEAIRESVEDFEYFVMLRAAVERAKAAGRSGPELATAETLLKTAVEEVLNAPDVREIRWHHPKDRTMADAVRVRLLESLEALK